MVTRISDGANASNHSHGITFVGLSTDNKPVESVKNGNIFFAMDTKKVYMYDEANSQWREI